MGGANQGQAGDESGMQKFGWLAPLPTVVGGPVGVRASHGKGPQEVRAVDQDWSVHHSDWSFWSSQSFGSSHHSSG